MGKKYLDDNGLAYLWGKLKDYFQVKLVSGTNIKTINNNSLLGSGNISISGGGVTPNDYVVDLDTITMDSCNWTYRRWNSGVAECWMTYTFTTAKAETPWGSTYYGVLTSTFEFPHGLFIAIPQINPSLRSTGGRFWVTHLNDATTTSVGTIYNLAPQKYTGNSTAILDLYCIGKWK